MRRESRGSTLNISVLSGRDWFPSLQDRELYGANYEQRSSAVPSAVCLLSSKLFMTKHIFCLFIWIKCSIAAQFLPWLRLSIPWKWIWWQKWLIFVRFLAFSTRSGWLFEEKLSEDEVDVVSRSLTPSFLLGASNWSQRAQASNAKSQPTCQTIRQHTLVTPRPKKGPPGRHSTWHRLHCPSPGSCTSSPKGQRPASCLPAGKITLCFLQSAGWWVNIAARDL